MADISGAGGTRAGLRALIQDWLSPRIANLLFTRMPMLFFLLTKDGNKQGVYGLGVPGTKSVFSGVPIERPRREEIFRTGQYMPLLQVTKRPVTDNKVMGQRDTMPTVSDPLTNTTPGYFERPFFRWFELATPMMVWNKDRDRVQSGGRSAADKREAIGDLWTVESKTQLGNHLTDLNSRLWTAATAPTNQNAEVWDNLFSFANVCKADNIYGGLDRALAKNAAWRGNFVTANKAAVLSDLFDHAQFDLGIGDKTTSPTMLMIVGKKLFPQFKQQARAQGYSMVSNDEMPAMGEFGFKKEIIRYNENQYVIYDPACPAIGVAGATKNVALLLTIDGWVAAFNPDKKFSPDEPFDQSKIEGGKDAGTANLRTEFILACEAPSQQVYFEDVGA